MKDKVVYPIIIDIKPDNGYFLVEIPVVQGFTQGTSIEDAIEMAREYIGEAAVDLAQDGGDLPDSVYALPVVSEGQVATLVDVNVAEFIAESNNRPVKKTLTIPYAIDAMGRKAGLNFSQTLAEAIQAKVAN
jgi:predicted RNase H-like HicB family nuclease